MRQGWPWLWMVGLPLAVRADPGSQETQPALVIQAEHARYDDGWLEAEGPLSLELGADRLEGEGLRFQSATGTLEIQSGTWTRGDQVIRFEEAELQLGEQTGSLLMAALESESIRLQSERLDLLAEGSMRGEQVTLSPCTCEEQLWSLQAAEVELDLGEEVRFRRGWIQVCDRRLLPIPRGRLPLQARKSGLLLPELAWGQDGAQIMVPVFWTMGPHADLLLEPEIRAQRGARVLTEGRLGLGPTGPLVVGGSAGWDTQESAWRGHASAAGGWSGDRLETAVDALWMSDPDVRLDYEDDYMERAEPWVEQRARLGVGAFRVETEQSLQDGMQRLLGGVMALPGRRLGPVSLNTEARIDLFANREDGLEDPEPRAEAGVAVSAGRQLGSLLRVEGRADLGGVAWQTSPAWGEVAAGGAAWLQTWGAGSGRTRLDQWGLVGAASQTTPEHQIRHPWDRPAPAWQIGPALRSRWITASGVPLSLSMELPMTPDGPDPTGRLRVQQGAWTARLQGSETLQELTLAWTDTVWGMGGGVVHFEDLWQGIGWLDTPPLGSSASLRLGWSGLMDLEETDFLSQGPRLSYASPCDCLELRLQALWSEDRGARPAVGLQLELL